MLTCLPQSLCSWDYRIDGLSSGAGEATFDWLTEQGTIAVAGVQYSIRKHGPMSGCWTLEYGGQVIAQAQKSNPLLRSFAVAIEGMQLTVQAQTPLARTFEISDGRGVLGTIWPAHPFTRRAFVQCDASVPEAVQLFSFWLAALLWRRAARSN